METKTEQRLRILKELREDRRKELEKIQYIDNNDFRVWGLIKELNYYEREILKVNNAIKKENKDMNEIAETLINNINNVIKVLNDTESCKRTDVLKSELTNVLKYTNEMIDTGIWTPLENENREEWN